ncbi:hypothetical protein CRYUN_Cryun31cG0054800 [Craigia yunnanensis]
MEKMAKDSNLFPDQVTYNTLIHMLSKHGRADEALEFLREAEARGFQIDKVGHSAIVHSYCKQGRIDEAKSIVNEMLSKGCSPDVVTCTAIVDALLTGLCRHGNSLQAREMMNVSEEDLWTPNAISYSVVMHGLRKEGKLTEACHVEGDG